MHRNLTSTHAHISWFVVFFLLLLQKARAKNFANHSFAVWLPIGKREKKGRRHSTYFFFFFSILSGFNGEDILFLFCFSWVGCESEREAKEKNPPSPCSMFNKERNCICDLVDAFSFSFFRYLPCDQFFFLPSYVVVQSWFQTENNQYGNGLVLRRWRLRFRRNRVRLSSSFFSNLHLVFLEKH